jgi:hypothetical protein
VENWFEKKSAGGFEGGIRFHTPEKWAYDKQFQALMRAAEADKLGLAGASRHRGVWLGGHRWGELIDENVTITPPWRNKNFQKKKKRKEGKAISLANGIPVCMPASGRISPSPKGR